MCVHVLHCVMHGSKVISGQNGYTFSWDLIPTLELCAKLRLNSLIRAPPAPAINDIILLLGCRSSQIAQRNVCAQFINGSCIVRLTVCATIY